MVVVSKSLIQPDGGEGCSGSATGYPATVLWKEAVPPRRDTASARGDVQESSHTGLVGRACNAKSSIQHSQAGILGARVFLGTDRGRLQNSAEFRGRIPEF
jgi:hypothetical protein